MPDPKKKDEEKKPRRRVKKVKGHGGHHGGAWKVAYADFVTAMMALFLVLWLVSQADTKVKQSIAQYFRSPGVFSTMQGGILTQAKKVSKEPTNLTSKDDEQALFSVSNNLQKQFGSRPEFSKYKDQIKIEMTEDGLKINLLDKAERVSFASGNADLNAEAKAILAEIGRGICNLPNKINIGGHTDKYVFGDNSSYTNWELSADRANAARRALEEACVKPEQINRIVGYADTEPLVPEDPYSPANRRISIMVLRLQNGENAAPQNKETGEQIESKEIPKAAPSEPSKKPEPSAENKTEPKLETKKAKAKLGAEGTISVGEPDAIPGKAKKTVEKTETEETPPEH